MYGCFIEGYEDEAERFVRIQKTLSVSDDTEQRKLIRLLESDSCDTENVYPELQDDIQVMKDM